MRKGIVKLMTNICMLLGIMCLLYFMMYAIFADLTNVFTYFWLIVGLVFVLIKPFVRYMAERQIVIPTGIKWTSGILAIIMFLVFVVVECVIIGYGSKEPEPKAEYVLVLGAQVKGSRPTYALQTRLDAAYEYAVANPESTIIVSGGKGPGEAVTEAEAMAKYLKGKGISEERIILEDKSTSTYENIEFSKKLMSSTDASVVLVTNHFHVYRGVGVAKKQGLTNVQGLGSSTKWYNIPNQYIREAFAVIKYKLCGQI